MLVLNALTFAQDRNPNRFSREETGEILLDKSKKEKTKGFIALGGRLGLSAIGIHLLKKDPNTITSNGTGLVVSESDNHLWGGVFLGIGVATTLSSPFFFIRSGRFKRKAKLLLSDESTSFLNQKLSIPSVGIQINL